MKDRAYWLTQIQSYADGQLGQSEVAELSAALKDDRALRRDFLELLNLDSALDDYVSGHKAVKDSAAFSPGTRAGQPPAQAPGLNTAQTRSPVLGFLHSMLHVSGDTPFATALMWLFMAVCTSVVLGMVIVIATIIHGVNNPQVAENKAEGGRGKADQPPPSAFRLPPSSPSPVVRLIHAANCRWAIGDAPEEGEDIEPGRKLVLRSGLAEFMFTSGAKALLQGPATLEIASKTGAFLHSGRVTVTVEKPEARGFEIRTPGMKYTDFGTEFGVLVAQNGMQEVHVFRGQVQAEREKGRKGERESSESPLLPFSPAPLLLSAHQAIRVSAPGKPMEQIAADDKQFVRTIPDPYAGLVLSMRPVAYYRMQRPKEAKDRLVVLDSAGGHNGVLHVGESNSAADSKPYDPYVAGRFGDALFLRNVPSRDYVIVPDYSPAKESQLSISAWAMADSRPDWGLIAANWGDSVQSQFHFGCYTTDGDLTLAFTDPAGGRCEVREGRETRFPLDIWQHVAFTIDGSMARLYRNGLEVAASPCRGLLADARIHSLGIGCKTDDSGLRPGSNGFWHGRIDELAVFHRALSVKEIKSLSKGK